MKRKRQNVGEGGETKTRENIDKKRHLMCVKAKAEVLKLKEGGIRASIHPGKYPIPNMPN